MSGRYRDEGDYNKGGGGGSRWDRRDSGGGGYGRVAGTEVVEVAVVVGAATAAVVVGAGVVTDKTNAGDTPEKTIENALWAFKQEIKHKTDNLNAVLLEAVASCSHKTLHYALLLGLLHGENPDWVNGFVAAAGQRFESELAAGRVDGPRLLLRLFACLSRASVLHHADVVGLLQRLLEAAHSLATAGSDPSGLTWQPWCDQLAYMVLGALVWGGLPLQEGCPAEHSSLLEAVSSYMAARPVQESVELRPMYGASDASDASAASDSGGASFLGQLWDAVQVLRDPEVNWAVKSIPSELLDAFNAKLAGQAAAELPPIQLPQGVPGVPAGAAGEGLVQRAQTALALQDRYPPRGGMVILDSQYTDGGRIAAERFVAEEYIIDALGAFDSHRVELVQILCSGLPLPYDYSGLLCETLFAQLLRLPGPRLCPVAFSALIAHAALLRPAFPKYLAGSVRQLYLRLQFLAPELAGRLADVLAHFITNMNFRWPWDRYRAGLSQPPGGPQRTFLVLVLQHLVGQQAGQAALLALLGSMYSSMSQRLSLALARLLELRLLSPVAAAGWLTSSPKLQFGPAPQEASASDAWALLHSILSGTLARYDGAVQHRARLQDGVRKVRTKLNVASEESAAAVEAQQQAEEAAARGEEAAGTGGEQRERIVWPGGEGGGSRSGPVHRAEVAALREQLMAKKLAAAEDALAQHEAQLAGLEGVRGETLLQCAAFPLSGVETC
ncbi:armadillo-type protein [Scenedesmus sp. NREL 46B-D3]|nr:armadillo-type protein [Scenedesmus sp. NREL 46B-D3]